MITSPGLFRLGLAAAVVLSHLSAIGIGRPAVFAFFALSGYWVTRMYVEKYREPVEFYKSRFLRIFLPFAVAYGLAMVFLSGSLDKLLGLPVFGVASHHKDILGVSWSLDIELQFYALVPLMAFIGLRAAAIASTGLFVLAWYIKVQYGIWTVFLYAPSFLIGAWIYLCKYRPGFKTAMGSIAVFLSIGAAVFAFDWSRPLIMKTGGEPFDVDWFGMAWVTVLTPWIAYNVRQPSNWMDRHFGNMSYALYITHWPVIAYLSGSDKLTKGAAILAVFVAFYVLVDVPMEKLRSHLLSRREGKRSSGGNPGVSVAGNVLQGSRGD